MYRMRTSSVDDPMKTWTAAAFLACTLAACSDDTANPVAPSVLAAPEIAAADPPEPTGLPAVAPVKRPTFRAAGHRKGPAYTGLRIVSDDPDYPGRIDQHETEKLQAVITRNDGVTAISGADWRTGNTHVATINQHGQDNPGRFYTIATARGLEARMTGMEVHPGPGRAYNDQFWRESLQRIRQPRRAEELYQHAGRPAARILPVAWRPGRAARGDGRLDPLGPAELSARSGSVDRSAVPRPDRRCLADRREPGWITVAFDTPPFANMTAEKRVAELA